jgi:creatinine amidohydrolase
MEKTYFADLTYRDVERILASERTPVLLFPVGATEPHGPHGPLATDVIISIGMCERACRLLTDDSEIRGLILPPLSFGVTRYSRAFPGPIHVSESTLSAMIVDVCESLHGQGLPYVILVNNHFEPEHVQTLHRALDELTDRHGPTYGYLDLTRKSRAVRLTNEFRRGECHAGRYETSLVLADRPEVVDREAMAALPDVPVSLPEVMMQGGKEFRAMGLVDAYCGAPAEATAEEGEESFAILAEMLVDSMRDLARGVGGRDMLGLFGRM